MRRGCRKESLVFPLESALGKEDPTEFKRLEKRRQYLAAWQTMLSHMTKSTHPPMTGVLSYEEEHIGGWGIYWPAKWRMTITYDTSRESHLALTGRPHFQEGAECPPRKFESRSR